MNTPNHPRLEHLESLLGKVFFVPCTKGTKIPETTYTTRTFEQTQNHPYRSLCEENNIAVYLGTPSGNVCAIDFDADEPLKLFLAANPRLAGSLRSRGARGAQVWVRIKLAAGEALPDSMKCEFYEWRANKNLSTISGTHPSGKEYKLLVEAQPVELAFSEIVWPDGWINPGDMRDVEALTKEFGQPMEMSGKGVPTKLNQGFFAAKYRLENDILWEPDNGCFYEYRTASGLWVRAVDEVILEKISASVRNAINECARNAKEAGAAVSRGHMLNHANFQRGTVQLLRQMALQSDKFVRQSGIIHCVNGMLDVSRKPFELKPFSKEFYSRNQVPVIYNPAARCPRFIDELLAPQLDADDQRLLQLWCGQALMQRNFLQVMLIITGTAGGGKGTIVRLVQEMVGQHNLTELRTQHLGGRFEVGFFDGKSLLCGADVEPDFLSNDGANVLKALCGADRKISEKKGSSDTHTITGDFNILVTCNSRLLFRLRGDSGAWARRVLWLPFEQPKSDCPDPALHEILFQAEGAGILNWMLEGTAEILECIANKKPFPQTARQKDRVTSLIAESDSVREFLIRRVKRSPFPTDSITFDALYASYLFTCEHHGWTPLPRRAFAIRSEDIMVAEFHARRDNHAGENKDSRGWIGVVLVEDNTGDDTNEPF